MAQSRCVISSRAQPLDYLHAHPLHIIVGWRKAWGEDRGDQRTADEGERGEKLVADLDGDCLTADVSGPS